MPLLRYGPAARVCLEMAEGLAPAECGTPRGQPLRDLSAAVAWAMEEPLDYPPLRLSTTPGDRVVLALDHGIPHAAQVVAAVIGALTAAGVSPDGIAVLRTQADVPRGNPCRLLDGPTAAAVTLATHDPADRGAMAYLAATERGEAVFLHRALQEADLVLPIGCVQPAATAGYFGIHGGVFPAFSDQSTLARFRNLNCLDPASARHRHLTAEADEVAWLLGVNFTVQLVPASGSGVMHVVAGQTAAVARRTRELYDAAWSGPVERRASLVVAAIEGDASQQTWENLGRALSAALRLVEDGGDVAVCCDLEAEPGPAVQQMAGEGSRPAALRKIAQQRPPDALPAAELARALDRGRVFLVSRLDPSLLEDLGAIPVVEDELQRLARRHRSCILLSNAPRAVVAVLDEA